MSQYSHRPSSAPNSRGEVGEGVGYVNPPGWSADLKHEELASLPLYYYTWRPANMPVAGQPEGSSGNNSQLASGRK